MIRNGRYYAQVDYPGHWSDGCTVRLESRFKDVFDYNKIKYEVTVIRGGGVRWGQPRKGDIILITQDQLLIPEDHLKTFMVLKKIEHAISPQHFVTRVRPIKILSIVQLLKQHYPTLWKIQP